MIKLLAIGLDYLMLKDDKVRGDVRARQLEYARAVDQFHLLVYAPASLGFADQKWSDNLTVYPTNSIKKAFFIFDAYRKAARIIRANSIDVLTVEDPFTCGIVGYLLKKRFGLPLNMQVHIDFCDNKYWIIQRKINRVFNRVGKFVLKRADTIRVGTQYEKDKLVAKLGIPASRINVIPVNSPVRMFQGADGAAIRAGFLKERYDHLVLFTGRLVNQKDIPNLLQAFKKVVQARPRTVLVIVGTGAQEARIKAMVVDLALGQNVCFPGSVPHEDVPRYLAACDVYVVPSIFEGTCIAMTEAMSAGKPVVVTQFAGAMDLVQDGQTGYLVPIRDPQALAEKILYVLDHPDQARAVAQAGQAAIEERFANNRNTTRIIELWQATAALGTAPRN